MRSIPRAPALLLALALAFAPGAAHADGGHAAVHAADAEPVPGSPATGTAPDRDDTRFGVLMAVACGGAARVTASVPHPVAIALTGLFCLAMAVDALLTPDQP